MPARRPESGADARWQRFPLAAKALHARAAPKTATATVPTQALDRHRDNWFLYLFVFLLPLQNIQTGYLPNLGFGLNFLNVMVLLSLAGAIATGGSIARREPVNRWAVGYAAYAIVSLLIGYLNVSDPVTHANVLKDQLMGLFALYLVQMSVMSWRQAKRVVLATLLPLPYIAKVVWIQHNSVASWHYSDDLRITGTFPLLGANEFAAFCVTVAIVVAAAMISLRGLRWMRLALLGGLACALLGVLYSYSRSGYVCLLLGMAVVVVLWRGRWKLMVPLLLAAVLLPAMLPPSVVERVDSTTVEAGKRDDSTEKRFVYWQRAWENFTEHPILGSGYHTFHHREINPALKDTHNLYLRTLTEGGLLGATVLLGLLLSIARTARRELVAARPGSWRYALALGVAGAWLALICGNVFGDRFSYYPMIAYFWVYVALMVKARHLDPAGDRG